MEFLIVEYNLVNIFSFLDKKSLCMYDSALLEKEKRDIFLECLKKLKYNHYKVCKWTYFKEISNKEQYVYYVNIKYILPECKNVIIYTKNKEYKYDLEYDMNIDNNFLEYIYIDYCLKFLGFINISALNLIQLTISNVCVKKINYVNFLYNIIQKCPKITTIKFVYCQFLFDKNILESEFKNYSSENKKIHFSITNSRVGRRI